MMNIRNNNFTSNPNIYAHNLFFNQMRALQRDENEDLH